MNTLVVDTTLEAFKITNVAGSVVIVCQGNKVTATNLDFLATKEEIFVIAGSHSGFDANVVAELEVLLVYKVGLDRPIDTSGSGYWLKVQTDGGFVQQLAAGIVNAPEFANKFGNPQAIDNHKFVQFLYRNVLDRAGENSGVQSWTNSMRSRASKTDVLTAFALSAENKAHVQSEGAALGSDGLLVSVRN